MTESDRLEDIIKESFARLRAFAVAMLTLLMVLNVAVLAVLAVVLNNFDDTNTVIKRVVLNQNAQLDDQTKDIVRLRELVVELGGDPTPPPPPTSTTVVRRSRTTSTTARSATTTTARPCVTLPTGRCRPGTSSK